PEGKGFPVLELLYNNSDDRRRLAEAAQQMWLKNLGIQIKLLSQEWKVFLESRAQGRYDICRGDWVGDYLDANAFLEIYASNNLQNDTGWKNYAFDDLIKRAASTQDKPLRLSYLEQAEAIAIKESPVIPLYFPAYTALVQPSVRGWYPNLQAIIGWPYLYLEDKMQSEAAELATQPIETGL
ncbi:MAG TPA: ABC transporter substrate-binding protein, partial [Opitutales bacterium]|nr:ABC transporter substrate-binding protein [Opitutales bacterium]